MVYVSVNGFYSEGSLSEDMVNLDMWLAPMLLLIENLLNIEFARQKFAGYDLVNQFYGAKDLQNMSLLWDG